MNQKAHQLGLGFVLGRVDDAGDVECAISGQGTFIVLQVLGGANHLHFALPNMPLVPRTDHIN